MSSKAIFTWMLVPAAFLLMASPGRANPSNAAPQEMLDLHNHTGSQQIMTQAAKAYAATLETLTNISENPRRVSGPTLGKLHVSIRQLRRAAADLQLHGETAGYDLELRLRVLGQRLSHLVTAFIGTPAGGQYLAKVRQVLDSPRSTQARIATAQRIVKLLHEKKWGPAYDAYTRAMDDLESGTVFFLSGTMAEPYYEPFRNIPPEVNLNRRFALRKNLQAQLRNLVDQRLPDYEKLLADVTAAADGLRSGEPVQVGDQALTGPQCVANFLRVLRDTQVETLCCRGMEWARLASARGEEGSPESSGGNRVQRTAYDQFIDKYLAAIGGLIAADTERLSPDQVAARYGQYIRILAALQSHVAAGRLQAAVAEPLKLLAAKSPEFAAEVLAYEQATGELLRWRERIARAQANAVAGRFPAGDKLILATAVDQPNRPVLLSAEAPQVELASLRTSAPAAIQIVSKDLMGKNIAVRNVRGLSGSPLCVSRYGRRHYARVIRPQVDDAIRSLESDLQLSAESPPLSLAAAAAIASAKQGDFAAVGGIIKGVSLEGVIPRFATLVPTDSSLVPLGQLPREPETRRLLSHVLLRFDVQPSWVQHRYFFHDLDASP